MQIKFTRTKVTYNYSDMLSAPLNAYGMMLDIVTTNG